jgi:hypothetical protein
MAKRYYPTNVYQKIFLGDIATCHNLDNSDGALDREASIVRSFSSVGTARGKKYKKKAL